MTTEGLYADLVSALSPDSDRAILRITATYEPASGPGGKVYPPTYPPQNNMPYVIEERRLHGENRQDVILDSVPSQANRAEEAILRAQRSGVVAVPLLELQHTGETSLTLTSLEFPHRYADAYARDSLIDGVKFDKSSIGQTILTSSLEDATGLLTYDPGSLIYGAWDSHRKGRQRRFPRVYTSEIIGWDPAMGGRNAGRMDPLNLVGAAKPLPGGDWDYAPAGEKVKGERLSEIGHGNIAPNRQHGGVTISSASRLATLSFAGLQRISFGAADAAGHTAARAVLAAYALLADRLAFAAASLWLRSGCELVLTEEKVEWVVRGGSTESITVSRDEAVALFKLASDRAADAGLAFAKDIIALTPSPSLARAIDFSLTKAESESD